MARRVIQLNPNFNIHAALIAVCFREHQERWNKNLYAIFWFMLSALPSNATRKKNWLKYFVPLRTGRVLVKLSICRHEDTATTK